MTDDDVDLPGGPEDELPPPVPPEARHPGFIGRIVALVRGQGMDLTPLRVSGDFRRLFIGQAISAAGRPLKSGSELLIGS